MRKFSQKDLDELILKALEAPVVAGQTAAPGLFEFIKRRRRGEMGKPLISFKPKELEIPKVPKAPTKYPFLRI